MIDTFILCSINEIQFLLLFSVVGVAAVSLHRRFPAVHSLGSSSSSCCYSHYVGSGHDWPRHVVVRRVAPDARFSLGKLCSCEFSFSLLIPCSSYIMTK